MFSENRMLCLAAIIAVFLYQLSSTETSNFEFDLKSITNEQRDELFEILDLNCDKYLTQQEFKPLLIKLFYSQKLNKSYVNEKNEEKLFDALNFNKDKQISKLEFDQIWDKWIKTILKPRSALIVVDVQKDFIAYNSNTYNGSMPVAGGQTIIPVINDLIINGNFNTIVYTYDWHPSNHCSFLDINTTRKIIKTIDNKPIKDLKFGDRVWYEKYNISQQLWPKHCIQNTTGAEFYEDLIVVKDSVKIAKGTDPDIDSYSAFWDNGMINKTQLDDELQSLDITDIYLTGVVYELCVGSTAIHGLSLGYRTAFIENAIKEIDVKNQRVMRNKLIDSEASLIRSGDVLDMVNGRDRTVEMGLVLARKVFKNNNFIE